MNVDRFLTIRAALLAVAAFFTVVAGAWAGWHTAKEAHEMWVRELVAQEAERHEKAQSVQIQYLVDAERRREDRRLTDECRLEKSEERCRLESDHRWKEWRRLDCLLEAEPENDREAVRACGPEPQPPPSQ